MKKERDIRLYLDDILEAIVKIEKYTEGLDFEHFRKDEKTGDAVIRNFSVIGEAVKHISPSVRKKHPDIPWKIIAGMRDKLVHEYFGIRYDVVWETIELRLSPLKVAIKKILDQMEKEIEKS
ncbi:MAG: DUF86 domain-containing protein [Methanosarcinales archaeon]|nr:MAG: DUF86 domain-containing protein [Methanosarcinales archaeon]